MQIYQQKQQIEMLTQELSRSRNQGEGAAATGGGDTAEEEKGKLGKYKMIELYRTIVIYR